jgi:uncharacterized phage protein gp47/JayE
LAGLDSNGFKRKTYDDLFAEMSDKARELFGENINLSARSFMGLLIRLFAWALDLMWQLAEKVYNSAYVGKAEGVQLENIGANKGIPREPASESTVILVFTGQPGFTIPEQTQFTTPNNIYFYLVEDVTLDNNGNGQGKAVSVEKGIHTNVGANTITVQAEPLEEITSVTNPEPAAGGRDEETYEEYRSRLKSSTSAGGKATAPAIKSALSETNGVVSVNVVINNKNEPDEYGNPPKSVHVYVLGGVREQIAEAIFDAVAGGIETVGQEVVMVEDISGEQHEVRFDFADEVNIRIQLSIQTNSSFPVDGEEKIKNNLIHFIGGTDSDGINWIGLSMGQDVIYSQLFKPIYLDIDGIEDVTMSIGRDGGELSNQNVEIAPHEVAKTSMDLIEVTVS